MPSFESSIAVVLGAGRGARMGVNKAIMTVGGAPWWRTQVRRLDAIGIRSVWALSPDVADAIESDDKAPTEIVRGPAAAPRGWHSSDCRGPARHPGSNSQAVQPARCRYRRIWTTKAW